jgi:uncharacterized OB-fold protein
MKTIALLLALCGSVTLPAERHCRHCEGKGDIGWCWFMFGGWIYFDGCGWCGGDGRETTSFGRLK